MSESKIESVLSGYGNAVDFARDFAKAKDKAEKEGFKCVISRINNSGWKALREGKALEEGFEYELWVANDFYTPLSTFTGTDYIYSVIQDQIFYENDLVNGFLKQISGKEEWKVTDMILLDFLLNELSK